MLRTFARAAALSALLLGPGIGLVCAQGSRVPQVQPPPPANPPGVEAKPAQAPDPKPAEKPAEPDIEFKYFPQNVQFNSNISFDPSGRIQGHNSSVNLNLHVQYSGAAEPLAIRNLKITRAVTDAGELLQGNSGMGEQRLHDWTQPGNQGQGNELYLNMSFGGATHLSKRFNEIVGTFEVVYTKVPLREGELKTVADVLNKRIRFKDTKAGWILFSRPVDGQIRIEYDMAMRNMLEQISFLDEGGRELPLNGWNGGGEENGAEFRVFTLPLPDKGRIIIHLYPQVETKVVSFRIADVPIVPPDQAVAPADLVIDTRPVPHAGHTGILQKIDPVFVDP